MLALVDVTLPDCALEISDLVSLEKKQHFGERFLPEFARRAGAVLASRANEQSVGEWIDDALRGYGSDARLLVANAVRSHLGSERSGADAAGRRLLALQEKIFFGA
jgi:hypothetical protein